MTGLNMKKKAKNKHILQVMCNISRLPYKIDPNEKTKHFLSLLKQIQSEIYIINKKIKEGIFYLTLFPPSEDF